MSAPVRIIGAGFGGLAAAIHLAAAGVDTVVHEKQSTPGGKAAELESDGFRFDTGPSLLTMSSVLEQLYETAGAREEERVHLQPVDPICRYFFPDGTVLDAAAEETEFRAQVERLFPGEGAALERFLDYSERIYELTSDLFLFSNLAELKTLLRMQNLHTLLHLKEIDAFRSVHEAVGTYFRDERLQQLFDRYATYNGSNPYAAPATLNIIPHVEYRLGAYYVQGGMHALVRSLHRIARRLGVEFAFGSNVERIVSESGKVRGIIADDAFLESRAVISNADAVYTLTRLTEASERQKRRYKQLEPSCSGLVFLWGVKGKQSALAHHNIFFSENYREEFEDIFTRLRPPEDPTVYVSITARADAEHAPTDHENLFVLVNMPYLTDENRNAGITHVKERVLRKLRSAGVDIDDRIIFEEQITPADLERRYNANRGSIYGISSNSRNAAFLRPRNRVRSQRGLYLCGGAAHPGGGVPLVLLSGRHAATALIEDLQ